MIKTNFTRVQVLELMEYLDNRKDDEIFDTYQEELDYYVAEKQVNNINYTHSCTELPIYMTCDEDDGQVFAAFTSNERCEIEAEESGTATQMTTLYFGERK